jgi:prepilin-type processing-associated H-X9-DG protein
MTFASITDGPANTILAGEINSNFTPWGHPVNWRDPAKGLNQVPDGFGGPPSRNGVTFLMADGSVRFLHNRTSPEVLKALSTPAAGDGAGLLDP